MTEIKIATGWIDCHFHENYMIAMANPNLRAGRPVFEGHLPATTIPDPRYPDGFMTLKFEDER